MTVAAQTPQANRAALSDGGPAQPLPLRFQTRKCEPWKGSMVASDSTSLAIMRTMSARMSLSENTAAKRNVGGVWAHAGSVAPAASAASAEPLRSRARRSMDAFMVLSPVMDG